MSGTTGTGRSTATFLTGIFQDGQPAQSISPQDMRDLAASMYNVVPALVTAAGTNQATATALAENFSVVNVASTGQGVKALVGYRRVLNVTAVPVLIYPDTGASFDVGSPGEAVQIGPGGGAEIIYTSSTQAYVR